MVPITCDDDWDQGVQRLSTSFQIASRETALPPWRTTDDAIKFYSNFISQPLKIFQTLCLAVESDGRGSKGEEERVPGLVGTPGYLAYCCIFRPAWHILGAQQIFVK